MRHGLMVMLGAPKGDEHADHYGDEDASREAFTDLSEAIQRGESARGLRAFAALMRLCEDDMPPPRRSMDSRYERPRKT